MSEQYRAGYNEAYAYLESEGLHPAVEREFMMGDKNNAEWVAGYRDAMKEMLEVRT